MCMTCVFLVTFQFIESDEEGETPYHCSVCGKNFAKRDYLKKHLIRHTGQKPYKCTRCHKSFTFKYGLKTHMMTHTRDMPFKCPVCGRCYSFCVACEA